MDALMLYEGTKLYDNITIQHRYSHQTTITHNNKIKIAKK